MKKHTNKLFSILLALVMLLSIIPMNLSVSAAPDTDYNGYYKLTNAGNLAWFACLVVGDTSQSGITEAVPDAKAVLTADIDITVLAERLGKSWVGIGTADIPFTGVFDGNGYTIKGLTTDTSLEKSAVATVPVDTVNQGLFGVIGKGGIVRDVVVEGTATLSDTIKYGAICSENNGTIENVLSMITVTGGNNADAFCHTNNGTITNCYTNQTATDATRVTAEELADGSVTYALGVSFGQTIGTDLQPVHFDGSNRVYKDGDTYYNKLPGVTISGTSTSFNSETDNIVIELFAEGIEEAVYSVTVTGNNASYSIDEVEAGTYRMVVSKDKHATREYEITVGEENLTRDVQINPIGDINGDGKITIADYSKVLKHVNKTTNLEGYELACADIDSNKKITISDYSKILKNVNKTEALW